MSRWQQIADAIQELQEEGQFDVFVGDYSASFDISVDDKGVYLTVCPHCLGEAVNVALGGEEQSAPPDCELH